jgi:hypothetical protein
MSSNDQREEIRPFCASCGKKLDQCDCGGEGK